MSRHGESDNNVSQRRPPPQTQVNSTNEDTIDDDKKATCCDKFLNCLSTWGLHAINIVDVIVGGVLLVLSLILFTNLGTNSENFQDSWLAYVCLVLGAMLLAVVGFGYLGLFCSCCRCSAVLSGYLAMALGFFCLVLATAFLILKTMVLEYFQKNGDSLGLSPSDIAVAEAWYVVIDIGLFVVAVLEGVRYAASIKYHETSVKIDHDETTPLLPRSNGV